MRPADGWVDDQSASWVERAGDPDSDSVVVLNVAG